MNLLSRFKVSVQIGAGFLFGIVLLAVVAGVAFEAATVMRARANEAAALSGISTLTRDVMANMLDQASAVRGYAITQDLAYLDVVQRAQQNLVADLAVLDKVDQGSVIDSERLEQIDIEGSQIESDIAAVKKSFAREIELAPKRGAAAAAVIRSSEPLFERLRRDNDALLGYTSAQAKMASRDFERALEILLLVLVASTAVAVAALAATATFIGGSIARRLSAVTHALIDVTEHDVAALTMAFDRLGKGDLSAAFESDRNLIVDSGEDEIATLAQSYNGVVSGLGLISLEFNRMTGTFRSLVGGIAGATSDLADLSAQFSAAAGETATAVDQIAGAMSGVARGARDQADRIATANASIAELRGSAQEIAFGSDEQACAALEAVNSVRTLDEQISAFASLGGTLADAAGHARLQAEGGANSVRQAAGAMDRIKDATAVATAAMKNLESSSSAVSDIVAVIHDIADQTNLLALNAAIEAARAGEQGRGFAVVADEVRKLAEKSRVSTGEISRILDAIREETLRAAQAIGSASQQVESGTALSGEATAALGELAAAIAQTSEIAGEVAARSQRMNASSERLMRSIASVSQVIDKNSAAASSVKERSEVVATTIHPVAESASDQAKTAREVSDATGVLSQHIVEMHGASQATQAKSEVLRGLVAVFRNTDSGTGRNNVIRIAASLALAVLAFHPHPASATTEFARRTLLSCGACHSVGTQLTDFGKAFKARGFVVPNLVPRGDVPATLQAQSVYSSDPDPTGLPKAIVDKVIGLLGGPIGPHVTYDGQQYFMDGGRPGDLREAWAEYTSSWTDRVPLDVRAGQQVLVLPTDPQRFKLSQQDYLLFVQTVGNNPFNLYEPMDGLRLSAGKEVSGLNLSLLAFSNHDQGSPIQQTGTDWMFVARQTFERADFEIYRYTGRRALLGEDEFWRQGYGANAYIGRFTLHTMLQVGNDTNPLGTGRAVVSSGGFVEGVYQIGRSVFAYAREDGVDDTTGNFQRELVLGTSAFIGRPFKLQVEDVLTHAPQTHNSLSVVFGIGISTIHTGSSSY